ncbi:MAG: transposase [Victivallales bacterium]|nr:transposase [Victivallales bacterium]
MLYLFLHQIRCTFLAVEAAWAKIPHPARSGCIGYGELAFLKAPIYKNAQAIKSIPELLRDLESRPVLCEMIGFTPGQLPDSSRFYVFLAQTNNSEIEVIHHTAVQSLIDANIVSLDILIADSKPVMANTKHNNPKNPNRGLNKETRIKRNSAATLSYYSCLKQPFAKKKKDFSWFWGYRTHVLISKEGIPLVEVTLLNNKTDGKVAKKLLKKLVRIYGQQKGRIFIGDAGYDERALYKFIVEQLKADTNSFSFIDISMVLLSRFLP